MLGLYMRMDDRNWIEIGDDETPSLERGSMPIEPLTTWLLLQTSACPPVQRWIPSVPLYDRSPARQSLN
jgi:hypothetical protein